MGSSPPNNPSSKNFKGDLPLWKRVFVCAGMLALESYITFEEIYLTTTLQRLRVPYAFLSLPGAISGGCGTFVVPLLGWLSDKCQGRRRRFAIGTLCLLFCGMAILIYVGSTNLYHPTPEMVSSNLSLVLNDGGSESSARVLTVTGVIAIVGFTFGDHGYDTSTLTVRSYILSISPESQHNSLLLTMTTMGAIGGCMTSLIGFFDLSAIFPLIEGQILDGGDAQFLVQSIVFVITLLLFTCTLTANSQTFNENRNDIPMTQLSTETTQNSYRPLKEEDLFSIQESEDQRLVNNSAVTNNNYESHHEHHHSVSGSQMVLKTNGHNSALALEDPNSRTESKPTGEAPRELGEKSPGCHSEKETEGCVSPRKKAKIGLMIMVFFVIIAMSCYFFYITNYVAEVIYKGDPRADLGSDAYRQYVYGTRVASLSVLTFYVVYVFYNMFHGRILDKIGMKGEFAITSLSVTAMTLIMVLTEHMAMVFLTMVPLAAYRSCCYTVPFILANKYAQQESRELAEDVANRDPDSPAEGTEGQGGATSKTGSALASVTVMIPLTYCLLCIVAGPLISLTDNTSLPIYLSIGAYGLGTLCTGIVDFD